ncbi:MAG: DUF2382 domain-containing protein [Armatimonadota bacterium]
MNIVTGVFDTVHNAEDAVQALYDAGFHADDVGIATHDRDKGERMARNLNREYRWPSGEEFTGRDAVYDRVPNSFLDSIRRSNLRDEAANWYRDRFDEGRILLIVNAGDRANDATRIIHSQHGVLYHERRETRERPSEAMTQAPMVVSHQPETRQVTGVPLIREEVRVERRRLDQPMHPDEYQRMRVPEDEIHVPIIQEEVRIERTPVVHEELVITRAPMREHGTMEGHMDEPPEGRRRPAA